MPFSKSEKTATTTTAGADEDDEDDDDDDLTDDEAEDAEVNEAQEAFDNWAVEEAMAEVNEEYEVLTSQAKVARSSLMKVSIEVLSVV